MTEGSGGARKAQGGPDTLVGSGMRIEGGVAFSGVLRVEGEVCGDIAGRGDAGDTLVIGASGVVAGTVDAPRIVVGGRVDGPLHARAIEVRPGGRLGGDATCGVMAIHPGGIVEGNVTQAGNAGEELPPPAAGDLLAGPAGRRRPRPWRALAVLALSAAAVGVYLARDRVPVAPASDPTPASVAPAPAPAPSVAAAGAINATTPPGAAGPSTATAPAGSAASPAPADAPKVGAGDTASAAPADDTPDAVIAVQGVNPAKPAGAALVVSREAAVLMRKKRGEPGEGARIAIPPATTESIAVGRAEIFRVASGRDVQIFYQGRKVPPRLIERGAWMSFVPQTGTGTQESGR